MKPTPQLTGSLREILGNLYTQAYADGAVGVSRTDDLYQALAQLEELIEAHIAVAEERLLAKMILDTKTVTYDGEQWNAILVKKLKTITFKQDEAIPKLSNTSNKEENNETRITNL